MISLITYSSKYQQVTDAIIFTLYAMCYIRVYKIAKERYEMKITLIGQSFFVKLKPVVGVKKGIRVFHP